LIRRGGPLNSFGVQPRYANAITAPRVEASEDVLAGPIAKIGRLQARRVGDRRRIAIARRAAPTQACLEFFFFMLLAAATNGHETQSEARHVLLATPHQPDEPQRIPSCPVAAAKVNITRQYRLALRGCGAGESLGR